MKIKIKNKKKTKCTRNVNKTRAHISLIGTRREKWKELAHELPQINHIWRHSYGIINFDWEAVTNFTFLIH
jgi:hypothetical protein